MRKGDIVLVRDGSYSLAVDGSLKHFFGSELATERYVVIETGNFVLPTEENSRRVNDTILQGVDSKRIVFIHSGSCQVAESKYCPSCGHLLTVK